MHCEKIEFGNIGVFADVASVFELYERLGILDRLNEDDIREPSCICFHKEDHQKLWRMISRESERRPRYLDEVDNKSPIFLEWLRFGPRDTGSCRGAVEISSNK